MTRDELFAQLTEAGGSLPRRHALPPGHRAQVTRPDRGALRLPRGPLAGAGRSGAAGGRVRADSGDRAGARRVRGARWQGVSPCADQRGRGDRRAREQAAEDRPRIEAAGAAQAAHP